MKRLFLLPIAILLFGAANAAGQDGLYAPVLPDDIAFVRVINSDLNGGPVTVDLGTVRIGPIEYGAGSPYVPVRPGVYVVFSPTGRVPVTAASGSFQTVIFSHGQSFVLEDDHHDDPLRAQLVVYNLLDTGVTVEAIQPAAPLFDDLRPGQSASLALNAIPVTLRASATGGWTFDVSVELTRGDSFAVIADSAHAEGGFVVKASVDNGSR